MTNGIFLHFIFQLNADQIYRFAALILRVPNTERLTLSQYYSESQVPGIIVVDKSLVSSWTTGRRFFKVKNNFTNAIFLCLFPNQNSSCEKLKT